AMAKKLGKGAGATIALDTYTLQTWVSSLNGTDVGPPDGPTLPVHIVSVVRTPEDITDAPDPIIVLPPSFWQAHHDDAGSCTCTLSVLADPQRRDEVGAQLREVYPGATIEPPEDFKGRVADVVSLQRRAWWAIGAAAAVAGLLALVQASARLVRLLAAG